MDSVEFKTRTAGGNLCRLEYFVVGDTLYTLVGIPTNTWCDATLYSLGAAGTRLSLGVPIGYLLLCLARHA